MGPGPDNPTGFFEDQDIVNINDRVLRQLGRTWWRPPEDCRTELYEASLGHLQTLAARTLSSKIRSNATFGLKDPRLSVLLPFWRPVFTDLSLSVDCVVVVRNPLDVAKSLRQRNRFPRDRAIDLWMRYMLDAIAGVEPHWRTLFVRYESLAERPERELNRISSRLELNLNDREVEVFSKGFLRRRRATPSYSEPKFDRRSPWKIYSCLVSLAEDRSLFDDEAKASFKELRNSPGFVLDAGTTLLETRRRMPGKAILVHLATGVGNIIFATPLIQVLRREGYLIDVLIDGDYAGVGELFQGWNAVRTVYDGRRERIAEAAYPKIIPAIPPFAWGLYELSYKNVGSVVRRPADRLFYYNEQAYYLCFAAAVGCDISKPPGYFLPRLNTPNSPENRRTLAIAPGCKSEIMAAKRWPFFPQLADYFEDVVTVGTEDDLVDADGTTFTFSPHVRSFIGMLSLKDTAVVLGNAAVVVANDSGLGHLAGALGVPTILLFGPTPDQTLGPLPENVIVIRRGLNCEPCWFGPRFRACAGRIDCLHEIDAPSVARNVARLMAGTVRGAESGTRA
jgi:ADP-heptose:LPS heptosyltransferase